MKKVIAALAAVILIAAMVLTYAVRVSQQLAAIPNPIYQPFSSWAGYLRTPPMAAGEYWIIIEYPRDENSPLKVPPACVLFDDTTKEPVSTDSVKVGARLLGGSWNGVIVGEFRATDGHRYTIEVDSDQVKELARQRDTRLTITLTARDVNNRVHRAVRLK